MVQIRVTPETRNPVTVRALWMSGVTWKGHLLNHAVSTVIVGARNEEQLVQNIGAVR